MDILETKELLDDAILEFEKVQDDLKSPTFISRRMGAIVKHMKELRNDLRTVEENMTPQEIASRRAELKARGIDRPDERGVAHA